MNYVLIVSRDSLNCPHLVRLFVCAVFKFCYLLFLIMYYVLGVHDKEIMSSKTLPPVSGCSSPSPYNIVPSHFVPTMDNVEFVDLNTSWPIPVILES